MLSETNTIKIRLPQATPRGDLAKAERIPSKHLTTKLTTKPKLLRQARRGGKEGRTIISNLSPEHIELDRPRSPVTEPKAGNLS